jgi:dTMP kinase
MYILFEGIDTCGKTTQIELLKQEFKEIIFTKEPGATEFGIKAREILLSGSIQSKKAELLLFLSDRAEHYEEIIKPNLNKTIISDRGFISGISYALANEDFDFDTLLKLNRFSLEDTMPDKVILFKTNMQTLQQRMGEKTLDGIELRGLEYLLSVQDYMISSIEKIELNHIVIDASDSVENIYNRIRDYILE